MTDIDQYVKIFKALSNPHRLKVFLNALEHLERGKEVGKNEEESLACQRAAAEELGIVPSTMSHHIKELTNAGLLSVRREGQQVVWAMNEDGLTRLKQFLELLDR